MGDEFISRKTIPSNKLEYSLDEGTTWTPMVKKTAKPIVNRKKK